MMGNPLRWPHVALALVTGWLPACSSGPALPPVHPVSGQVTWDGKPLSGAQVVLVPAASKPDGVRPSGRTDREGRFALTTFVARDGAPEGDYSVVIDWRQMTPGPGGEAVAGPNVVPARFADESKTILKAHVAPGNNELPPFQLTSR